jgi:hypothetical protein
MNNKNIKYIIEYEGAGVIDYLKNVFTPNSRYTNSSNNTLKQYGDFPVVGIQIRRQPILKVLDTVLKVISLGTFDPKKYGGYDKLFHLFMVVTVKTPNGNKDIVVEKNQSINISTTIPKVTPETERLTIASPTKPILTLNSMLENTLAKVGANQYFVYDPFTNNCQRFITDVLDSNQLLGDRYRSWILQDITELTKKIPQYTKSFAKSVTDLASFGERLLGLGEPDDWELHAVIVKKPMELNDLQKIQKEFIKTKGKFIRETNSSYRIRNIPKTKFIKKSFRTKKINKNISLVFGKLL